MDHIQDIFRHGAEGYTPATMWFTSGNIHKPEMTYQIEGFNRQKIRDYFIHPSDNTQGDYLGEHFFDMIRHAASEARRLGMNYWIYDEYNWSSGVVVGKRLWDPYRLDLSPFVAEGINRLEIRVTGTLSNFIYNRNLSGLKSISLRR